MEVTKKAAGGDTLLPMQYVPRVFHTPAILALAIMSLTLNASADVTGAPADEAAIRKFIHDTEAVGFEHPETRLSPQVTAENADFINVFGGWTQGRALFLEQMRSPQGLAYFIGKTREHTIESIRFLRPDVAIVIVKFFNAKDNGTLTGDDTRASYILTKEDGTWKLNAFHNTTIVPGRGGNAPAKPAAQ